jgi:pectinesterase
MAASYTTTAALSAILVFSLFAATARSDPAPAMPVAPSTACNETTDPTFCRTVLPANGTNSLYTYGRFSVAKSLANSNKFLTLVNRYLSRRSLSPEAVGALQDCQLLSGLNIDFLSAAGATLNTSSDRALLDPQVEDVQTLLSAILTNQQTCADGLQAAASAWSVRDGLAVPMVNSTKIYSVALSLFTRAWVPDPANKHGGKKQPKNKPPHHGHARRGLFDATDDDEMVRRMALEGASAAVPVVGSVTVDPSGAGNFTTVGDAVAAAPSNLKGDSGYFLIHVTAGVYDENVVVPKNKKYVMMVGDGIGQSVITGNRSVVDGWTTFNSATFGEFSIYFSSKSTTITVRASCRFCMKFSLASSYLRRVTEPTNWQAETKHFQSQNELKFTLLIGKCLARYVESHIYNPASQDLFSRYHSLFILYTLKKNERENRIA